MAAATCQGVWLSRMLEDLLGCSPPKFRLKVDNKSAIELSKNPVHHDRTKHIDTRSTILGSVLLPDWWRSTMLVLMISLQMH
jgi:hypothetical protein